MARRPVPPPTPKTPTLTAGQKARRVERLQKCIAKLDAFDPQKARKRAPAILELEAAIDKALCSVFGYGTPTYLQYNQAASLDPSPFLSETSRARLASGSTRQDVKLKDIREQFSENKARSIRLLKEAVRTLEEEIAQTPQSQTVPPNVSSEPKIAENHSAKPRGEERATRTVPQEAPSSRGRASTGFFGPLRRYFGRWWPRPRR